MAWGTYPGPSQLVAADVLRLIEEDYACSDASHDNDGFIRWQQGATPKEHREMLDRQWMIEREHEWRKESQDTQERIVTIAKETATATKIAAWAQAGTVLAGVIAIIVALFFGGITIEDNRSNSPSPAPAVSAMPESP